MRVAILGPPQVEADGQAVTIRGTRLRVLLIRLALDAGRVVTVDSLSLALWPDGPPGHPAHAVQSLVSRLRQALPGPPVLRSAPDGYLLDLPMEAVDAAHFEQLARAGKRALRSGDAQSAARLLGHALGLWRGDALADVAARPFAAPVLARLNELRLSATEDRIAADLQTCAEYSPLIAELQALTVAQPLRERLRYLLVKALHADDRPGEALAAYAAFRELLADQLGADPGPELQEAHQVVLRGDEAPQRPRRPTPGNLRAPLSSFTGRDGALAQLSRLLTKSRLVTVTGPGGVGKTRLASVAAAAAGPGFPGGVWLVELAPLTAPDHIAQAMIGVLALREDAPPQMSGTPLGAVSRLVEALAATETLVLLDNCEHLIDAVAPLVEELLGRCPRLRVIATSREPLGLPGELLCPVAPLGLPGSTCSAAEAMTSPSVRLFAERAAAAIPSFTVTDANIAVVSDICRQLDGLPLAIELAAARLRALPLAELAARLDDRFELLANGNRTALPRHRTLRAVVAWSWDLLSEAERGLADSLAVFPADITPESAEAVIPARTTQTRPVLDLLAALVDKSLLQVMPGPEPRYRMLETIREFGIARLAEAGELAKIRSAHMAYFLQLAETAEPQLRGHAQLPWLARLTTEHDNLLAALNAACAMGDARTSVRLAAALGTFWTVRGWHADAAALLPPALEIPGETPEQARAAATAMWAFNATLSGGWGRTRQLAEAMRARLGAGGFRESSAVSVLVEPALALIADDLTAGLEAIDRRLHHPDPWTRAMLHVMRAFLEANHGDMAGQRHDLDEAVAAFRAAGERWGLAMSLTFLAYTQMTLGEFEHAASGLAESVRRLHELSASDGAIMQRVWLAETFAKLGDTVRARAELLEIIAPGAARLPGRYTFLARFALGDLARFESNLDEAARQYEAAAEDLGRFPASALWISGFDALLHCALGHLAAACDDIDATRRHLDNSLTLALAASDMPLVATVGVVVARLKLALGDRKNAARVLGAAHALRGAPDAFNPDVVSLTAELSRDLGEHEYQAAYEQGRRLKRTDALALVKDSHLGGELNCPG